jgi:hypothetical protein
MAISKAARRYDRRNMKAKGELMRKQFWGTLGVFCLGVLVVGCGTTTKRIDVDDAAAAAEVEKQRQLYVSSQARDQRRVQELAGPLLTANADLCGEDIRPYLGMTSANVEYWPKEYRNAAAAVMGVGERVQVLEVIPDGPADAAGLNEGDILLRIAGKHVPTGKKATKKTAELLEEELEIGVPATFAVERGGVPVEVEVTPAAACSYYVVLTGGEEVNAYADGTSVFITRGMMRFAETDSELVTVIAHELAHNAMGHIDKKTGNYVLGSIFDVLAAAYGINTQGAFGNAAAQAYSQDFEAEADYVGLYAMAKAGYNFSEAPTIWRRMGAYSGSIESQYGASHPGTAERFLALDTAVQEVIQKQESGRPLIPDAKE